jgi:signal transduction histidine kinase
MSKALLNPTQWIPRGLFFKIFGWFLAAQLLIALVLYLLASATQRSFDQSFYDMLGGNLENRVRAAAIAYETGGKTALQQAWSEQPIRRGDGPPPPQRRPEELDQEGPPRPRDESRGGRGRPFFGPRGEGNELSSTSFYLIKNGWAEHLAGPVHIDARFELPPNLQENQNATFKPNPRRPSYLLRRVDTSRGSYLGVVRLRFERGRPPSFFDSLLGTGPNGGTTWRPFVVALMMGALCFALARYLTAPTIKLRQATRQFAAGDFSVRVGPQLGKRRDELGDLGHDFDQMAERIQNLLVAQRQLLGDISHELRSPLTRLSLALELADLSADETTKEYLARMESEVHELNSLIGQLLTLTRLENMAPETREGSSDAAYIDLSGLIEHVVENANFEAQSRGGEVVITHNDDCHITGNGELLHSAVENVVRNAIIHSGPNPRIEIALRTENRVAKIRVRDHGTGVPPETLEQIFNPFYRVAQARDRQTGGTGLGLSITQRAARFHGGNVQAKNAEGGGLEIEITLPLGQEQNEIEQEKS